MKKNVRTTNSYHINPKFRAYGRARLDIAQRAGNEEDWQRLWKNPSNPFPFTWDGQWKQCVEYRVYDFAAEVGFFIDILGLPVNAFDPDYAMFTSPAGEFYFSVVPASDDLPATPPDAIRIQFMVADIQETALELERRGIPFELWPQPVLEGSSLYIGYFRTPHGICVDLWGTVQANEIDEGEEHPNTFDEITGDRAVNAEFQVDSHDDEEANNQIQGDLENEQPETPQTRQESEQEELIHFNLFGEPVDSRSTDVHNAEVAFPPGEDQQEVEVDEIEYEYIDDEV